MRLFALIIKKITLQGTGTHDVILLHASSIRYLIVDKCDIDNLSIKNFRVDTRKK